MRRDREGGLKRGALPGDAPEAMKHSVRVLACRSAPLAAAYCVQIREAFCLMGQAIQDADPVLALQRFESALGPLQKLMVFAAVAADLLRDAQHPLRREFLLFGVGLEGALDLVEVSIVARDFAAVVTLLQSRVIPSLDSYTSLGPRLTVALQPRLAVA